MAIETPRLRLEPWDQAHAEMLARLGAIPSVVRYVGSGEIWPREKSQEVHDRQVEHWRRHGFGWRAAVEKASGRQVGLIALNFLGDGTAGLDSGEYEIGWWLHPGDHGRGFAREGAHAVRDEARDRLGAPSVVARIQPPNRTLDRRRHGDRPEPRFPHHRPVGRARGRVPRRSSEELRFRLATRQGRRSS